MKKKILPAVLLACAGIFAADPCSQPGTIFCNGFEGTVKEVNDAWQNPYPGNLAVNDPGPFNTPGNKVLKMDLNLNRIIQKRLGKGYDKLYGRWYQKYDTGYDWGKYDHHGFTMCSGDGCQSSGFIPDGCTGTTYGLLESGGTGNQGSFHWYAYHPGKETVWGNVYNTGTSITSNRWYCVEVMMDLGTPTPSWDNANGVLDVWVDGVHYGPNNCSIWPARCGGVWLRSCDSLKIRTISVHTYHTHDQPAGVSMYIDDVVFSTQRIGPGTRVGYTSGIEKPAATSRVPSPGLDIAQNGRGFSIRCKAGLAKHVKEVVLYSQAGQKVHSLFFSGSFTIWDGRGEDGRWLNPGIYIATVKIGTNMWSGKLAVMGR